MSNMDIGVVLVTYQKLHTEIRSKMVVSRINNTTDGRLVEVKLEFIKVKIDLVMTSKNTNPFTLWESSRLFVEWQWLSCSTVVGRLWASLRIRISFISWSRVGDGVGQVQNIDMSDSFHNMEHISKNGAFDSILTGCLGVQLFVVWQLHTLRQSGWLPGKNKLQGNLGKHHHASRGTLRSWYIVL